jgi:hypothetical protein
MITRVFDRFGLLRVVLLKTSNHVVNAPLSTAETTPSSDFARLLRQTSEQLYSNIFVFTLRMFLAALSSKTKFVVRFLHKNGIYILMRSYVLSAFPLWQIIVPVLQMTQHVFDM